ncbi:MAG TPA: RraA family protein [Streptosporangiaceae bacterium]
MPEPSRPEGDMQMSDLIDRYLKVTTCQVSDALHASGLYALGLVGIAPLDPARRVAGPALPVSFSQEPGAEERRIEYLERVTPGDVLVIANGRMDCSCWGGQRSIRAIRRGAVATIVDGSYRDVEEHQAVGYPVWGRGRAVAGSRHAGAPVSAGETVRIGQCAISRGDVVLADASGVVVVPAAAAAEVLARAETLAAAEAEVSAAAGRVTRKR